MGESAPCVQDVPMVLFEKPSDRPQDSFKNRKSSQDWSHDANVLYPQPVSRCHPHQYYCKEHGEASRVQTAQMVFGLQLGCWVLLGLVCMLACGRKW